MRQVCEKMNIAHHFSLPYFPWSNGTVEVVCRELSRTTRALLSELKRSQDKWPILFPILQRALNNKNLRRLGNRSPLTVLTGLPCSSKLVEIEFQQGESISTCVLVIIYYN